MVSALIFAGGVGRRMNSDEIPKQFLEVDGKSIIIRTLEHFSAHRGVDAIVVVCLDTWIEELKKQIADNGVRKVVGIIPGGETGYQSIHKGLLRISEFAGEDDIVLICDGVRPMLTEQLITTCIHDAEKYESAVPVTPSIDSVLYSEDGVNCKKNYERSKMFITQAPQGYTMRRILSAHKEAEERGMESTSSADLLVELGQSVHIFRGIRENIKVTTPEDLNQLRSIHYYGHFKTFAGEVMTYGL